MTKRSDALAAQRRGSAPRQSMAFGSQVRSYVLQPYQLVKDLRTGVETTDVEAVLDGGLDAFMEAALVLRGVPRPRDPNAAIPCSPD